MEHVVKPKSNTARMKNCSQACNGLAWAQYSGQTCHPVHCHPNIYTIATSLLSVMPVTCQFVTSVTQTFRKSLWTIGRHPYGNFSDTYFFFLKNMYWTSRSSQYIPLGSICGTWPKFVSSREVIASLWRTVAYLGSISTIRTVQWHRQDLRIVCYYEKSSHWLSHWSRASHIWYDIYFYRSNRYRSKIWLSIRSPIKKFLLSIIALKFKLFQT